MSKVEDRLLDHDYDGIQEYDNPLPRWWLGLFYFGIVFAVVYIPYYHFGPGPLMHEEFATEMAEAAAATAKVEAAAEAAALKANGGKKVSLNDHIGNADRIAKGKVIYTKNCVACHLADGGGVVGPNFTDKFWIHGGSMKDIIKTITKGVPEKGMIAWEAQLSKDDIIDVAVYIKAFKGTTPANPKAAEGKAYEGP